MNRRREMTCSTEAWEFREPFTITGYTFTRADLLVVTISEGGKSGRGEGAGVYYLDETGASMRAAATSVKDAIEAGADRERLRELLPPGGARNAIDCALWDLEAKLNDTTIWELTGIEPGETRSVVTIGIGTPEQMANAARMLDNPLIKVKLDNVIPVERITAIRAARQDAELVVDVNQGWTFAELVEFAPRLADLGVAMIEQPLPRGGDEALEGYRAPLPLCADESCRCVSEFEQAARRYQMINIKLDKCGGLTEALAMADWCRRHGIPLMVGNMLGSSLAMAPAFVVAQACRFVDLDGPLWQRSDRAHALHYDASLMQAPEAPLWG